MARSSIAKRSVRVTVLRSGLEPRPFSMQVGATLADLLREVGEPIAGSGVLIDGKPIEEIVTLKTGMTVSLGTAPPPSVAKRSWRDSVGTVQDTPEFREMIAAGRAIREADTEAPRDQFDSDGV
jgi:hypothetical protein